MVNSIHRSGSILRYLAATLTGLMIACGDDYTEPRVVAEVDTVGGVVVVRNGTSLWRESEKWQVVEEFRVGGSSWGENPDEELGYSLNVTVTLGPNGQIFVLERAAARVLVFSGDGEFVRSFGRAGEGPGEFRSPMAMMWDGTDRLWIADALRGRYHVFDSTGTIRRTVPRPGRAAKRLQHPLVWWEGPGIVVDEAFDNGMVLFLGVDTLGQFADTVAKLPDLELSRGLRGVIPRPSWESMNFVGAHYIARLRWSLAPDGTIWSATTGQLRLVQTNASGDTIRLAETSHRTAEFDRRDRAVIAEGLKEAGISRDDVELIRPVLNAIYVMNDGHILVGIIEEVGEHPRAFDVFNPDGVFLGSIDLGFELPYRNIPALVGDTIIAVSPGAFDVPYLVRATIKRPN